jgi:hypothetical protein
LIRLKEEACVGRLHLGWMDMRLTIDMIFRRVLVSACQERDMSKAADTISLWIPEHMATSMYTAIV